MKVLVIGSGLAGVATAWYLRAHGAEVTVVDRDEAAAMETSRANAGMLTPSMADPWNHPGLLRRTLGWLGREDAPMRLRVAALPSLLGWGYTFWRSSNAARHRENTLHNVRLACYSLAQLRELQETLAIPHDQLRQGTVKIFRDHASLAEFRRLGDLLADHGVPYRDLDRDALIELEPCLAPVADQLVGGLYYPEDGSGDAHRFCQGLAERAQAAGVVFRFGTTVRKLRLERGAWRGIETDQDALTADACVVAAGSYSPLLLRNAGIRLGVRPVKGYSITVPFGAWGPTPRRPLVDEGLHLAATPLGDRLRVAGTAELAGWDTRIRPERIEHLVRFTEQLFPTFADQLRDSDLQPWTGLRPMSCDGVPILGPTPIAGLWLNTGYGHLGWTLSTGAGRLVADLVTGRTPHIDPAPYRLSRF